MRYGIVAGFVFCLCCSGGQCPGGTQSIRDGIMTGMSASWDESVMDFNGEGAAGVGLGLGQRVEGVLAWLLAWS